MIPDSAEIVAKKFIYIVMFFKKLKKKFKKLYWIFCNDRLYHCPANTISPKWMETVFLEKDNGEVRRE
jgi:hypothetical protein